jgi:hypothetical protein
MSPGPATGGGLGLLVLLVIGYFLLSSGRGGGNSVPAEAPADSPRIETGTTRGGNDSPFSRLPGQDGGRMEEAGTGGTLTADEAGQFVDVISANVNDVWTQALPGYTPPRVVVYEQGTQTGCGFGQSAMGPFYCPSDQTVYIDLNFWQDMQSKLGASNAEFARAYVLAHEFGHHVQLLTGVAQKVRQAQSRARSQQEANQYQIAMELQADCYAGVWAVNADEVSGGQVSMEPGDAEEGMKTAQAIGDDMIQRRMTGRVSPEGFTHGTAEQRTEWLYRGMKTGDPNSCDTFR